MENSDLLLQGRALRRFAVFVDGMARAMILPFGPELIYRIINGNAEGTPSAWSSISLRLALTIATFILGHSIGEILADKLPLISDKQKRDVNVGWVGGATMALSLFSWGAGYTSVAFLVVTRFFYALSAGVLRGITDVSFLSEDSSKDQETLPLLEKDQPNENGGSDGVFVGRGGPQLGANEGTAKIYLTGFAFSALSGGFLYDSASTNEMFQRLTSNYMWSPIFFIGVTVLGKLVLRGTFAMATQPEHPERSGGAVRGGVRKFVRRIAGAKCDNPRVSFKDDEYNPGADIGGGLNGDVRQRTASMASINSSEFYDCNSEMSEDASSIVKSSGLEEDEVAQYVSGKCCYADGSAAYVPPGDCTSIIPDNYLENCNGDRNKAMEMWQETQKWRRENCVWKIHAMPNTYYHDILKAYPHFAHGYSKNGLAVMYEQPGRMNLKALFQGACTIDDMVHHYIFFNEFLSNCLCASDELRRAAGKGSERYNSSGYGLLIVMDVGGAGVSMLSTDVLKYLTRVSAINQAYYPISMKRVCVVNCPFWASGVFQTIKKILPDSVQADLFSAAGLTDGLRQYIDDDQIPPEYGGSCQYKLGEHPFAIQLTNLVESAAGDGKWDEEQAVVSKTPEDMISDECDDECDLGTGPKQLASAIDESIQTDHNVRRRAVEPTNESADSTGLPESRSIENGGVDVDSLAFIWFFSAFWSGAQGAIEIAIPLWLSSPEHLGGLGYSPSKSGTTMFWAALLCLFMLTTTTASTLTSKLPQLDPVRSLRLGLVIESASLFLFTLISVNFT